MTERSWRQRGTLRLDGLPTLSVPKVERLGLRFLGEAWLFRSPPGSPGWWVIATYGVRRDEYTSNNAALESANGHRHDEAGPSLVQMRTTHGRVWLMCTKQETPVRTGPFGVCPCQRVVPNQTVNPQVVSSSLTPGANPRPTGFCSVPLTVES